MNYFIFDCETNGLYGETLSICAMVYDESLSVCRKTFYGAWKIAEDKISNDFVRTQVYPYLDSADMFFNSEQELLQHFWQFWKSNREDCRCIADVPVPVEANVFRKCVAMDEQSRWNDAPFPLIDLASILMANNIDPLADRNTLAQSTLTRHSAKNDVLLTVEILRRYLNMDNITSVYSYHTFFFLFVYSKSKSFEKMCDFFEQQEHWKNADFQSVSSLREREYYIQENENIENGLSEEQKKEREKQQKKHISDSLRWDYQTFQYFNPPARRALFGCNSKEDCNSGIVHNYRFRLEKISERKKTYYIINKGNKEYKLTLNGVNIKIYNTGIAVFSFECENYLNRSIADVKFINDYGRRIFYPFLPHEDDDSTLCADKISIKGFKDNQEKVIAQDDFIGLFKIDGTYIYQYTCFDSNDKWSIMAQNRQTGKTNKKKFQLTNVPNIIEKFLDFSGDGEKFTSNVDKKDEADKIYIYPAIDDRMFVACIVLDGEYGQKIRGDQAEKYQSMDTEDIYAFQTDYEVAKDLYELLYIDPSGKCSCVGASMLKKLLNEQMYTRWLYYGTVQGITHHSFVSVASSAVMDSVINPFLIEYTQMVALCLAQRASIMAFQDEATEIAKKMGTIDKKTVRKTNELIKLQSRYTQFMNEVYFVEITAQEQGIELYDMMKEAMYIEKEREILESQIDKMSEVANTSLDVDLNHHGLYIAIVALILSVSGSLIDVWGFADNIINLCVGKLTVALAQPDVFIALIIIELIIVFISITLVWRQKHGIRKWVKKHKHFC